MAIQLPGGRRRRRLIHLLHRWGFFPFGAIANDSRLLLVLLALRLVASLALAPSRFSRAQISSFFIVLRLRNSAGSNRRSFRLRKR